VKGRRQVDADAKDIEDVHEIMESAGLETARIPVAATPRCDLRARDAEGEQYMIEVKGFHDNEEIGPTLREGKVHAEVRSLVLSQAIEAAIEDAINRQIPATPGADVSLCMVVLIARTTFGAEVTRKQILGTLYGLRAIVFVDSTSQTVSQDCLYFSESAFHRHPQLDAAILIDSTGVALMLNDFGLRIDRARRSLLSRFFNERGALKDAATLETRGFFWADCPLDRRPIPGNEGQVLEYVKKKYSLAFAVATSPKEHSAMVAVARARRK